MNILVVTIIQEEEKEIEVVKDTMIDIEIAIDPVDLIMKVKEIIEETVIGNGNENDREVVSLMQLLLHNQSLHQRILLLPLI